MIVGFTGTRDGMTPAQKWALAEWLDAHPLHEFHHGACVGADEEAVGLVHNQRIDCEDEAFPPSRWWRVYAYPASGVGTAVSGPALDLSDQIHTAKPPLDRNRNIVTAGIDGLLAGPKGGEELRSGTWSTVRYARLLGRRIVIFWPDGRTTEEAARGS